MAPSSGLVVHVRARLRNDGSPVSSPLRAASRWYVGHSVVVDTAGVCDGAWLVAGADDPPSEQPASSSAVTMVIARWTADSALLLVQAVDERSVLLGNHLPLHLERRRELVTDGEVLWQKRPLLHVLDIANLVIDLLNVPVDLAAHGWFACQYIDDIGSSVFVG